MKATDRLVPAVGRLALFVVWTLAWMPLWVGARLGWRPAERGLMLFYRGVCRIVGLTIERRGEISTARPTLFACNHMSYLDILVLGASIPGSFVAKHEIRDWPFFGPMARLSRTVFVERRIRFAADQRDQMTDRLAAGDNLILFPEGTSSDGNRVMPYKSALFSVVESRPGGAAVTVQPVSIAYSRLGGLPMPRYMRPYLAWYGQMLLFSHLWRVLGLAPVTVVVEFHPTVTIGRFGSRKELSAHCQAVTATGVSAAIHGVAPPTGAANARDRGRLTLQGAVLQSMSRCNC